MLINTKQIIDEVELLTNKYMDELTEEDLNSITELNINEFNIVGEKEDFFIEDLALFKNLRKITFNKKIINKEIMDYILNSNIEELNLYNCEIIYEFNSNFDNINTLRIEYVDNFKEEYLNYFPNVSVLAFKGYILKNTLSERIKRLDIANSTIDNIDIIKNSSVTDLYISLNEYRNHKDFYLSTKININVYDSNNCYILEGDDYYE